LETKRANKAMVIGIDSPIAARVYRWAREGKLPALKGLLERGVHAPNCLVPLPTVTPPNWTTIATGAWPGTHGITDYMVHLPGQPLHEVHNGYLADEVQAETLWDALARVGKKAIIVNWPTTWPPRIKNGCQIGGFGLAPTDWQFGLPVPFAYRGLLAVDALIATDYYVYATEATFGRAHGWSGVEHGPRALEATVTVGWRRPRDDLAPVTWHILVDSAGSSGYDTAVVAKSKDKTGVYARLHTGQWSENIYDEFQTSTGPLPGVMRLKLLELSADAQRFRLYVVGPCALHGWGYPASIEKEIVSAEGLPTGKIAWEGFAMDWLDADTIVEAYHLQNAWLADASLWLLRHKPWHVFFTHLHSTDWLYHYLTLKLDPLTAENPAEVQCWQDVELRLYQDVDWAIGRILEAADEDTLVTVVSDHGAKTQTAHIDVNEILERAGLLAYLPGEDDEGAAVSAADSALPSGMRKSIRGFLGLKRIDWKRTKAVAQRNVHVYVNLRGRDPDGIVEPGAGYEQVVEQIVDALLTYVDPATGKRPIALALKREDARIIGHYTDRSGDVVYAVNPGFGREHAQHLTTARYGIGDLRGLFIMAGPGVRRGATLTRNVWLTDVVPTVCHLTGFPVPRHCEGSVIYQALQEP